MSVAIGMGSDADEPIMRQAAEALNGSGVAWQMRVLSAHRSRTTPSTPPAGPPTAASKAIIAGAGGAADVPGVPAAVTHVAMIGVPIGLKQLAGLDSLRSIVQMPRGVPLATVAVEGAHHVGRSWCGSSPRATRTSSRSDRKLASRWPLKSTPGAPPCRRASVVGRRPLPFPR